MYGEVKIIEQPRIPKYEEYESLTKEELIEELVNARISEARSFGYISSHI